MRIPNQPSASIRFASCLILFVLLLFPTVAAGAQSSAAGTAQSLPASLGASSAAGLAPSPPAASASPHSAVVKSQPASGWQSPIPAQQSPQTVSRPEASPSAGPSTASGSAPPPEANQTSAGSVAAPGGSPLSTPSNLSPAPGDPTNHWWDLWSYSDASLPYDGSFVAGNNYVDGMNGGDQILLLPMNVALGTKTDLSWFQFDIEYYYSCGLFNCSNGVDWYIWDIISPGGISTCNPSQSQFYSHDISSSPPSAGDVDPDVVASSGGGGLSYNPADAYAWSLYATAGNNAVFLITDTSNGNFWWAEFSVPSLSLVVNSACFSPVSGVEGYTSTSTTGLSNFGSVQFDVKEGATAPVSEGFQGSGEPPGIQTSTIQHDGSTAGGGDWYWEVFQSGTFPSAYTCSTGCASWPSEIDLGQTADITLAASNLGPAQAVTQTMTLSFPGASASELSVKSSDLTTVVVGAGSSFPACYDQCTRTLSYPLVEGRADNWNPGTVHTITVAFTPTTAGVYTFYYKTIATSGYPEFPMVWSPDSTASSTQDQQGEWDYAGAIAVTVPISITLLHDATSDPISGANYFTADYTSGGTAYTAYFTGSSTLTLHVDGGSHIKVSGTSSASTSGEKWCLTASCAELDLSISGSSGPRSLTYYYFDLLKQSVSAGIVDGGSPTIRLNYTTAPALYFVSDNPQSTHVLLGGSPQTIYALRGTGADVPACTPSSTVPGLHGPITVCDDETWAILPGTSTSWTIASADQVPGTLTYYHQYFEALSFTTSDGSTPPSVPTFSSLQFGSTYAAALSMTSPVYAFLDAGAPYTITPNPLAGSTSTERWEGTPSLLGNTLYEPMLPFTQYAEYSHQFLVTFGETGLDPSTGASVVLSVASSSDLVPTDYTYSQFPAGDWIDSGAVVHYVYSSPVHTTAAGTEFALQTVDGPASGFTVSGVASPVTANYASEQVSAAACAGTSPTDTCTGTPSQPAGTLSADSTSTGVSVDLSGTSASGTVTLTMTDDGPTPPPTGADLNLGGGGAYYDVKVSGASDGVARVCITNFNIFFGTTMDYWNGASWVGASDVEVIGVTICGDIPVSALAGSPIGIGTPAPTACAGTSPVDVCAGIPVQPGGLLSFVSGATGVSLGISGTTAAGKVVLTITDEGGAPPPPPTGPDANLLGATGHYYDVQVTGASDGTADTCIPDSNGATTMDYYDPSSSAWTSVHVAIGSGRICGDIPVSALSGTPVAIGTPAPTPHGVPQFPLGLLGALAVGLPLVLSLRRGRRP